MIALGHVRGAQSEAVYPFEVRVGGEPAKYEGGVFAKIAAPCPPDAVLEVPSATEMVIINVFPVAADGTVAADAGSHTKVLLIPSGTKVRLNETTDRSTLAPGLYGANVVTGQRTSRIMFSIK
jgi:hypothetical protein